jgi:hypothetical protein
MEYKKQINVTVRIKPLVKKDNAAPGGQLWQKVADQTIMNTRTKELYSFD